MSVPGGRGGPDLPWGGPRFWQGVWRVADPKITLASVASMLLGLAVTLPILGHATWHLYRRAVR